MTALRDFVFARLRNAFVFGLLASLCFHAASATDSVEFEVAGLRLTGVPAGTAGLAFAILAGFEALHLAARTVGDVIAFAAGKLSRWKENAEAGEADAVARGQSADADNYSTLSKRLGLFLTIISTASFFVSTVIVVSIIVLIGIMMVRIMPELFG